MSAAITPSASNSKVLILINITHGASTDYKYGFRLLRGSTVIDAGDSAGSRKLVSFGAMQRSDVDNESGAIMFLDSPSTTSSTTYKIQGSIEGATFYINRTATDSNSASHMRSTSNITLVEIGA